jgi:hypothetical protein
MEMFDMFSIFLAVFPALLCFGAYWALLRDRKLKLVFYYDGTEIIRMKKKIDASISTCKIGDKLHDFSGVEPVPFNSGRMKLTQMAYLVDYRQVKALDLKRLLEKQEYNSATIPPEALNVIIEGNDIKNAHSVLKNINFSLKNPLFIAGLGVGIGLAVIMMLIFYHPSATVQLIDTAKEAAAPAIKAGAKVAMVMA